MDVRIRLSPKRTTQQLTDQQLSDKLQLCLLVLKTISMNVYYTQLRTKDPDNVKTIYNEHVQTKILEEVNKKSS